MADGTPNLDRMSDDGLAGGFLSALPPRVADALLAEAIRIDVPAGGLVYREDESPRVFIVVDGVVRVFLRSSEGRQVTFRYARRGDVAGLVLVLGGPAPMSIEAMTSAAVLALRVDSIRSFVATDAAVARVCAEELSRLLYRALGDLAEHAFAPVRERVARQLLDLAVVGDGPQLVVRASQQELADAIASVREVVTRNLHQLQDDGLIAITPDEIVLLDPGGLADELSEPWFRPGGELMAELGSRTQG